MNNYTFYENQLAGKKDQVYDYFPTIASNGDFKRLSGIDVPLNSIRNLLLTPLGQYPFDPNFGSLLFKQVFEPYDNITLERIKYECQTRIERYYDKITIESVQIFQTNTITQDGKSVRVDVNILRNKIPGKITLVIPEKQIMFGLEDDLDPGLQETLQHNKELIMRSEKLYEDNESYRILYDAAVEDRTFVSEAERIVIHQSICQTLGLGDV